MHNHKKQASAKTGLLPGTPVYVGENPPNPTNIIVHVYDMNSYKMLNTFNAEEINEALSAGQHVWIDISGLADSNKISKICTEYTIHPLIIEDLLNTKQRPKLDIIEDYIFIVFKLLETPSD